MAASIVIYSQGWDGDRAVESGEEPSALLNCVVEINGGIIPGARAVTLKAEGGDFTTASIEVIPSSLVQVSCGPEEWRAVCDRFDNA